MEHLQNTNQDHYHNAIQLGVLFVHLQTNYYMFTDFPNTALFPLCADAPKSKMETRLDS
jgi:hypothetical protein